MYPQFGILAHHFAIINVESMRCAEMTEIIGMHMYNQWPLCSYEQKVEAYINGHHDRTCVVCL